jgi:hypothetical protein
MERPCIDGADLSLVQTSQCESIGGCRAGPSFVVSVNDYNISLWPFDISDILIITPSRCFDTDNMGSAAC